MLRPFRSILVALAVAAPIYCASGFALLGPLADYQTTGIGYNPGGGEIGGPMNLGEEYRWNIKVIYYGFDPTFINYFGQKGVDEVNKAIAILNALPAMSSLSSNLTEYPNDSRRVNSLAGALGLTDLKSEALGLLVEEMGLASPERWVWTLYDSRVIANVPTYTVIKRNFDPVTWTPSSYVNGTLYTYVVRDPAQMAPTFADAVESPVDPQDFGFTAVASAIGGWWGGQLLPGEFFAGLSRDDVGGLRYIYAGKKSRANYNVEDLIVNAITNGAVAGGAAWQPAGSQLPVGQAVRPGVDKFMFKQVPQGFGVFPATTNFFKDTYLPDPNKKKTITQTLPRAMPAPDIIFLAADLGPSASGIPFRIGHSDSFVNNGLLNTTAGSTLTPAGPGQIQPPVFIYFNSVGPDFQNFGPNVNTLDELTATRQLIWGSFDGTTNLPTVYPNSVSIEGLVQQIFNGN